ncbi:hypothetical protein SETIT_2G019100v2 [Setaria italica]|uniref:F-box domain-containing protein n=1 Tax=Setaria italica TaxID=4555 RepID=A0A368PUP2_SETIT|nr:hypothetical protein SETIT_2G019100v2 [Setaria italica]
MAALPALMEELVEEILLRVPPEEPAHLIRAAMVCKAWCRILSDGGFRRRYSRFHRMPTLMGYICSVFMDACLQFVPTTSFSPPLPPTSCYYRARDCRHDRVLIQDDSPSFIVWDLITGNRQHLSSRPCAHHHQTYFSSNEAVLCARHQHGCDHLDCHGGPFLVVSVKTVHDAGAAEHDATYTCASVYSSETGAWSAETCTTHDYYYDVGGCMKRSLLIGDALYFTQAGLSVIHGLSVIDTPLVSHKQAIPIDVDGCIGIVQYDGNCICTWSRQVDLNGLETVIPTWHRLLYPVDTIRFVEGTNTVLLCLGNNDRDRDLGVFTLNLKSRQVTQVAERWDDDVLPYTSFYAPDE